MGQARERVLGMFAKYWQPGQVKTRLAADLGAEKASHLYYEFLEHLSIRLADQGDRRCLVFTPPVRSAEFEGLAGDDWELIPQVEGDLGERMRAFLLSQLEAKEDRTAAPKSTPENSAAPKSVVLIGSDTPHIGLSTLQAAFEMLESRPVVIGPSSDGGYYLIGMSEPVLAIFEGISWSSNQVLQQTVQVLEATNTNYQILEEMFDIDTVADLDRLLRYLPETRDYSSAALATSLKRVMRQV